MGKIKTLCGKMSEEERQVTLLIYSLRCADEALLIRYVFCGNREEASRSVQKLLSLGVIELVEHEGSFVFFLTSTGVLLARELRPDPQYRIRPNGRKKFKATAEELMLAPRAIPHQLKLNELGLEIQARCSLPLMAYRDNKFLDDFSYFRPDGLFEFSDFCLVLEMDMGSESLARLVGKWAHYRNYLVSNEYHLKRNKRMIVLFATENVVRPQARRSTVLRSLASSAFDLLGPRLECYVAPSVQLVGIAVKLVSQNAKLSPLPSNLFARHGLAVYRSAEIDAAFGRPIRCLLDNDSQLQFLVEDYRDRPLSILKAAVEHERILSAARPALGPRTQGRLLLLCPEGVDIAKDFKAVDAFGLPNVYFTTSRRLRCRELPAALFQFDRTGGRYHFSDKSLTIPVYERKGG